METIISNPGLHHLAEKVFWNLDGEDLKICAQINQSCKQFLKHPIFCLRKFRSLSKTNRDNWIKVIQSVKNSDEGIAILSYLRWNLKKEASIDLPCYTRSEVQDDLRKKIYEISVRKGGSDEDLEIVKIIAPLTDNPNAPDEYGNTPIFWSTFNGHKEIAKILASLIKIDSFNEEEYYTLLETISYASHFGFTEIVELLTPMIDNPQYSNLSFLL